MTTLKPRGSSENQENREVADRRVRKNGTQGRFTTTSFDGFRVSLKLKSMALSHRHLIFVYSTLILFFNISEWGKSAAFAMPQLFLNLETGNERDVSWKRIETQRFSVYHDNRALPMARYALSAAEFAYPHLSYLLGVRLKGDEGTDFKGVVSGFSRIPMVISSQADGAAFANLATQSIELPLAFGAQSSLYHHELVHRLMYEHFDPGVGVAGRIVSLAMVPTWWMEGLPEMLTESMGRLETEGVMRTMALEKSYLSFDRLHALYKASGDIFLRGYITSGRFLNYLFERMGNPDIEKTHKEFSTQVLIPPFMNAINQFTDEKLKKSPSELYEDFMTSEQTRVQREYAGMPKILQSRVPGQDAGGWVVSSGTPHVVVDVSSNEVFVSQLGLSPYPSAFLVNKGMLLSTSDDKRKVEEKPTDLAKIGGDRLPINFEGSRIWDLHPNKKSDGEFWTVRSQTFANGTFGHQFWRVKFKGKFNQITDDQIVEKRRSPFATIHNPRKVYKIWSLDNGQAFALSKLRGATELFLLDSKTRRIQLIKKWDSPNEVRLVENHRIEKSAAAENCVSLIINTDLERTSLEKVCTSGRTEMLIPAGNQYIRAGVQMADNSYVLLVGWHKSLGLLQWTPAYSKFLGGFTEWIENLSTWDGKSIGAWVFDGYNYTLQNLDLEKWTQNFAKWDRTNSAWDKDPEYNVYQPPFVKFSALKQAAQKAPLPKNETENAAKATQVAATYRHSHWYSYPLLVPPPLDSWSLGLVSVPWNEEMERQRLQIYGTYNFFTKSLSGTVTYFNQRLFDGFSVDVYSRERFNGLYFLSNCTAQSCKVSLKEGKDDIKRLSTLREMGLGIATVHRLKPSSLVLATRENIFRIAPQFGTTADVIGAQTATIGQIGSTLTATVFDKAFYTRGNRPGGRYVLWTNTIFGTADYFRSLGRTQTGRGKDAGVVEFQKYGLGANSGLGYRDHAVTLRGSYGTTQGSSALNWKEVFQPYRTFLSGSGASLNNLNFPLAGDNSLFSLRQGLGFFRTSLDYSFDLVSDIDTQFYIFYFENLRGEFVLGRGGATSDPNLRSGYRVVDSASMAARLLIDIKGVQVFPSLAAGKILGAPGWALFTELAFAQLF